MVHFEHGLYNNDIHFALVLFLFFCWDGSVKCVPIFGSPMLVGLNSNDRMP